MKLRSIEFLNLALTGIIVFLAGCEAQVKSTGTTPTTLTDHGSAWDLTTAFPGSGAYSGVSSAIMAADVCSTKTFLGIPGTADCTLGKIFMSSSAYRSDNATIDLSVQVNVDARVRATLLDEAAGNSTFSTNHVLVPDPFSDTDGRFDASGIDLKRNYLETVKGRPDKVCGLSGTNDQRITDCATENTSAGVNKALYEGAKYGQNSEGDWKLVTLYKVGAVTGDTCATGAAGGCFEVWRDERTQLIWSDIHQNNATLWNWFQAAGYAKNASTISDTFYEGGTPTSTGKSYTNNTDCTNDPLTYTCQDDTPISVCADAGAIAGLNGIATYQNPDGTNGTFDERPAKGNLTGASRQWRLPTNEDYKLADVNGIRKVLPNMDFSFWTATSGSEFNYNAWLFYGDKGRMDIGTRVTLTSVRCVGR